ncbi:hypothetical protein BMR07_15245 [Methylococcaceae bacterium CS1]|nr:hypothetical protein BMR11_15135 [Methylococcaceae bacterium CS5]TXL03431.1 hypothetical protein BMR07_15245 [Methylococcaceae bacterium CS1]TXL06044.1 hypothetical protein BMR08_15690 [Methylococcaceae bacterium CS2]
MVGLKKPELYISWPSQSLKNELHLLVESKTYINQSLIGCKIHKNECIFILAKVLKYKMAFYAGFISCVMAGLKDALK